MPVQPPVGFRPLGIRITSVVHRLESALLRFVAGGSVLNPAYYFTSMSQRRSTDIILRLIGA
ncbi:hypothetical protein HAX54_052572, partial [Datura stramonium]|nr:hypothetical protein [Datura stramonium]